MGPASDTIAIDASAFLLTDASAPSVQASDQTIRWTTGTTGATPDGVVAQLAMPGGWRWFVTLPGNGVAQLPKLPTDLFDFSIHATDTVSFNTLDLVGITGGYRRLATLHPWVDADVVTPPIAVAGTSGTAVFVELAGL